MHTLFARYSLLFLIGLGLSFIILLPTAKPLLASELDNITNKQIEGASKTNVAKRFKVGVSYVDSYPLFSFADIADKGFAWAVLEAFAAQNNIEFDYIPMPITRLQPSMDNAAIDFIFPDNPIWFAYRSNRYPNIYSGPLISTISSTFVRTSNADLQINEIKKVAIPFGYTANTWFDGIKQFNIQSVPVRDLKAGLNSVRLGTVDAADIEYNVAKYLMHNHTDLNCLSVSEHLPSAVVNYHLSSIKHILILENLTKFVENNPQLIVALKQKYNILYYDEVFSSTP
jgi:ABC-type amino acid transport substrate-binding protein